MKKSALIEPERSSPAFSLSSCAAARESASAFAYYAPAWERLFTHFDDAEELEEIARWTKCIISIRCNSLDTETPEAIAALHRMLGLCEDFYHSAAYLNYNIEEARMYGYAESLLASPLNLPEVKVELKECTRLREQLKD